jgi:WD40 repeat protein
VRIWDPATGATERTLHGHTDRVNGVCAVWVGERELLASASADHTVRIWDPATGATERTLHGHTDWLNGVCAVRVGERELLASASIDRTVRIWDPATGHALHVIPVHHEVLGLTSFNDRCLVVGSSIGLLALSGTWGAQQ